MRLLLVLLLAAPASAQLSLNGAYERLAAAAAQAPKPPQRRVFPLSLQPVAPAQTPLLLDVPLSQLADAPLSAVDTTVSGRRWTLGVVTDDDYDEFFVVLRSGADEVVAPLAPIGRFLERGGVLLSDDEGPVLRLNARISLLHPINGTTIVAVDADDATDRDSFKVGELVEALKQRGRVYTADGAEYLVLVMQTAGRDGRSLSGHRSIYVTRMAGARTRAWAVREDALQPGHTYRVQTGDAVVTLLRTADGRLVMRDAR